MRSKILQEILDNTPESVKKYVDLYADIIVARGEIEHELRRIKRFNENHGLEWETEYSKGLNFCIDKLNEILK
jgi:hypothetical protein